MRRAEKETRLGRIGFTRPARRTRVEGFGESLRVSTIREGVFDEKKRREKKRKEKKRKEESTSDCFYLSDDSTRQTRAGVSGGFGSFSFGRGRKNGETSFRQSLSLSRARAVATKRVDVASRLTLRADFAGITPAEIILQLVNDERATDDGVGAAQRNLHVLDGEVAPARGGLDVAEIPGVTNLIRRRAVIHVIRVKVRARGHAPVGRVAEFVHVQTVLPRGETRDGTDDFRRTVAVLRQFEHAGDARRAREHAHRRLRVKQKNITDDDARVRQSLKNASSSVRRRFASRRFLVSRPGTHLFFRDDAHGHRARRSATSKRDTRARLVNHAFDDAHRDSLARARPIIRFIHESSPLERSRRIADDRVAVAPSHRPHAPRGARARRDRSRARDRGRKRERVHDERANECARGNEGQKMLTSASTHRRHRATRDDRETTERARWRRARRSRDSR